VRSEEAGREEDCQRQAQMKLASYMAGDEPAFGIVSDGAVITLSDRMGARRLTLKDALAEDELLDELVNLAKGAEPDLNLDGLKFLPTITDPGKILCVGINYRSHAAEHGGAVAEKPNIFTKFTDCLLGHDAEMWRPKASQQLDFE